MYPATKTLEAINEAILSDGGAAFRGNLEKVIPHIGDAYNTSSFPFRGHMGASGIGKECPREIWYGFRWARKPTFPSQTLRLFNRGHLEEARFIAMLLTIGVEVYQQDQNGNQYRISGANGYFGGSGDGVGIGIPDIQTGLPALLEFKTANDKKFKEMKKSGVAEANFIYYVQMQVYMYKMGFTCALFMMVNKNNDELYAEIVMLDNDVAECFLMRSDRLVAAQAPPPKISEQLAWHGCKWCDYKSICHLTVPPLANCRTCKNVKMVGEGKWECGVYNYPLDQNAQLTAHESCGKYERMF